MRSAAFGIRHSELRTEGLPTGGPDHKLIGMSKASLVLPLVAVVSLMLSGCGPKSETSSGSNSTSAAPARPVIAVIPKGATHPFWRSVRAGAEAAGKELNCQINWNSPERESDRERQIQIIEDFIAQKVDGVVLAPLDRTALVPSIEKLDRLKIPCVIIDSAVDADTNKYLTFAATDNYLGGQLAARRMNEILGGKGNVIVVKYAPGSASTMAREAGFTETIEKEFPGIKIVDSKYGLDTVETALQASEDMLTRNKDVQGLFAVNTSTAVGALQAMQSQRRTEIKMIGFDAEKALIDALKAGQIDALVVQDPFRMGYEGVKCIVAQRKGEMVPKRIDTGVALATKANLEDPKIKELLKTQ
jgi:ribose transport system substrate-binding protein